MDAQTFILQALWVLAIIPVMTSPENLWSRVNPQRKKNLEQAFFFFALFGVIQLAVVWVGNIIDTQLVIALTHVLAGAVFGVGIRIAGFYMREK